MTLFKVLVHCWPIKEQSSTNLGASVVRTKRPTRSLELDFTGDFARGRVALSFGPLIGVREFSITQTGQGRCVNPGMSDWVLDPVSLKNLRVWKENL